MHFKVPCPFFESFTWLAVVPSKLQFSFPLHMLRSVDRRNSYYINFSFANSLLILIFFTRILLLLEFILHSNWEHSQRSNFNHIQSVFTKLSFPLNNPRVLYLCARWDNKFCPSIFRLNLKMILTTFSCFTS